MSTFKRKNGPHVPQARSYWLYGVHAVKAALLNPKREVRRLVVTAAALEKIGGIWEERKLRPEILESGDIARLLPEGAVHQGAALEVSPLARTHTGGVSGGRNAKTSALAARSGNGPA